MTGERVNVVTGVSQSGRERFRRTDTSPYYDIDTARRGAATSQITLFRIHCLFINW